MKIPTSLHKDSDEKLGEMILHVSRKCEDDPHFGATKLNKILFFADCISFLNTGKSISNSTHMRLGKGPVMRRMLPVREKLINSGRAALQKVTLPFGLEQHRLIALDNANIADFSPQDISLIDVVIERLKEKNATEVSEFSHRLPAWQIAEDGEEIPLEAAFIFSLKSTPEDETLALELAEKHGW